MFNSQSQAISRARAISGETDDLYGIVDTDKNASRQENNNLASSTFKHYCRLAGLGEGFIFKIFITFIFFCAALCFIAVFTGSISVLAGLLLLPACIYFFLKRRIAARAQNFEKDYTALLVSLASAIRSGIDPIAALMQAEKLFAETSEISRSLSDFKSQIEKGVSEEDAVMSFASDIAHPDVDLFRSAFILARSQGSSIGECLHRLARVTRQRQSFRRKMRAAIAMQKLSAVGIAGCAVIIGVIQWASNSKAMLEAFNHPIGSKVLYTGLALIALGLIWMLNMSRNKV